MAKIHNLLFVFSVLCSSVSGQAIHTVMVGVEGSFYNPSTISAQQSDIIRFVFAGDVHTVTQTSFDAPCVVLPGGFSSGFEGRGANFSGPIATWDLIVANASMPIYFFCEVSTPSPHCAAGMVGAINPPSIDVFNQFVASAKLFSGTPSFVATPVLTGVGAFATNSAVISVTPTPPITQTPSTLSTFLSTSTTVSSTSSSPISSASPSTMSMSSAANSHIGAIIGGAVGGGVFLLLVVVMSVLLCRHFSHARSRSTQFFNYTVGPRQRTPSDAFLATKIAAAQNPSYRVTTPSQADSVSANALNSRMGSTSSGTILQPQRYLGPNHSMQQIARQASFASSVAVQPAQGSSAQEQNSNNVNIQVLAKEVAAVLSRNPESQRSHGDEYKGSRQPGRHRRDGTSAMASRDESPAPPNYRTALSTAGERQI